MRYELSSLPQLGHIKKIFFVGIKGVGVAPLALIAKEAGFTVAGSDLSEVFITDHYLNKKQISISHDFHVHDVALFFGDTPHSECLIVTTGAHGGFDNPQVVWGKEQEISVVTQGQALGLFMEGDIFKRDFKGIAIAGSHGKTTISSLLSTTLSLLHKDPTYTVGTGELFPLGAPGHYGKGEYFIAESDEYASEPHHDKIPKFLYQNPTYSIFNNIDFDHPDLFKDTDAVEDAFVEFAHNIKSGGMLFINSDDKRLVNIQEKLHKDIRIVSYGENNSALYQISDILLSGLGSRFTVKKKGVVVGEFEISIPGLHNARNALSVVALLLELGFSVEDIQKGIKGYTGSKRRMERKGKTSQGFLVFDDYGHHPLEIASTLKTLKNAFSDKKLICVFQPHTFSRTKSLLSEFSKSFSSADTLVLLPVFKSQRDTEHDNLSLEEYVNEHKKEHNDVKFFNNFSDVIEYIASLSPSENNLIVTMGAGDVYKIGEKITTA